MRTPDEEVRIPCCRLLRSRRTCMAQPCLATVRRTVSSKDAPHLKSTRHCALQPCADAVRRHECSSCCTNKVMHVDTHPCDTAYS